MMPRIYLLECQFTDQQGNELTLQKKKKKKKTTKKKQQGDVNFSEACIFYPLFLNAFYYKSTIVRRLTVL